MKLRKLGLALVVALALGAVMASSAFAAAETSDVQWYTGSSTPGTLLSGEESVSSTGEGELVSEVGTTKLVLKATGLECVSCTIFNEGGTGEGKGHLKFTGVTVVTPSVCAVKSKDGVVGQVTTEPLKITPDFMIAGSEFSYPKFEPATGTTFATFELIKGTGSCPIAGTYSVTGTEFVKTNNKTNVFAVNQEVTASGAINKEAGGELKLGAKIAELSGSASFALSGANKGTGFATH